jgi:hypothetical protein
MEKTIEFEVRQIMNGNPFVLHSVLLNLTIRNLEEEEARET